MVLVTPQRCTALVLHPAIIDLEQRIDALRAELRRTFLERITLVCNTLPSLRSRYDHLFGDLERIMDLREIEADERHRTLELVRRKLDRGGHPDVRLITRMVRSEFAPVRARCHIAARRHAAEITGEERWCDEGRIAEIRSVYRRLARLTHPDYALVELDAFWAMVKDGRENWDLDLLLAIDHAIETLAVRSVRSPMELREESARLQMAIRAERAHLASLRELDLVVMSAWIENSDWVRTHRFTLAARISELEDVINDCDELLRALAK